LKLLQEREIAERILLHLPEGRFDLRGFHFQRLGATLERFILRRPALFEVFDDLGGGE
jgi:hypothetical protein